MIIRNINSGYRCGLLTVIKDSGRRTKYRNVIWECKCSCGNPNPVYIRGGDLAYKKSRSCGCLDKNREHRYPANMTGQYFGELYVIKDIDYSTNPHNASYLCKCSCGNEIIYTTSELLDPHIVSCGCVMLTKQIQVRHGMNDTHIYIIYKAMKYRCYNSNNPEYHCYGGRGIIVCDEWLDPENGFINFYNWAISHGYRDGLTIERIDVNGPYAPWNCKWIPKLEQSWNKQDTIKTIDGYSIARFAYNYGISWRHIRDYNPDVESITVEELYERYFWPNGEPIVW